MPSRPSSLLSIRSTDSILSVASRGSILSVGIDRLGAVHRLGRLIPVGVLGRLVRQLRVADVRGFRSLGDVLARVPGGNGRRAAPDDEIGRRYGRHHRSDL